MMSSFDLTVVTIYLVSRVFLLFNIGVSLSFPFLWLGVISSASRRHLALSLGVCFMSLMRALGLPGYGRHMVLSQPCGHRRL